MPLIDNFSSKHQSKKFKKTAYRPWTIIDNVENQATPTVVDFQPEENSTNISHTTTATENQSFSAAPHNVVQNSSASYESVSNQSYNGYQPENNQKVNINEPVTNQKENKLLNSYQPISNQISNQICQNSDLETNINFRDIWTFEKALYEVSRLVGLQKKILLFIGTRCISKDSLSSGPISLQELKQLLETDIDTIKTATQRLVTKEFVLREVGKRGTGGFSLFRIQSSLKQAILKEIQDSQMPGRLVTNTEPKKLPKTSINNSNFNNSTINNTQVSQNWLPIEWQQLNIFPLEEIGFTESHLAQIYKFNLFSPEMVEDSIKAYAFDLQVNDKAQKIKGGDPLNYFMGIMKKGTPYAPSSNYEDPEERAYKVYIEKKKLQQHRKNELEKEAFKLAFNDWIDDLTDENVSQIIPEPSYRNPGSPFRKGALELHFKNHIWENILEDIKTSNS